MQSIRGSDLMDFDSHRHPAVTIFLSLALFILWLPIASAQQQGAACPPLVRPPGYGPYDYTNPSHRARELSLVERHHLNERVQSLDPRGQTGSLVGDLEYVLQWYPNHHRALELLTHVALQERNPQSQRAIQALQCRFQWARQVAPHDEMVPIIEGLYHHRSGRRAEARKLFESAVELAPQSATAHYNLGLVLVDLRDFVSARHHAERAYALGFPLPGLRNRLARAGHPLND